jgi:hypothetical protein
MYSVEQIRQMTQERLAASGLSMAKWCRQNKCCLSHVSDFLRQVPTRCGPPTDLLNALGLVKVISYVPRRLVDTADHDDHGARERSGADTVAGSGRQAADQEA